MNHPIVPGQTALARHRGQIEPWRRPDWQRLWLASQQSRAWKTLAIVPASPGAPAELLLRVAVTMAQTGMLHLGVPIRVADGTRITLADLVQFEEELRHYGQQEGLTLIALPALSENVTAVSLAQAADASLLIVLLRYMSVSEGKKTVERIGARRFIGSAVLRPPDE